MSDERFAEHLSSPRGRGHEPANGHSGVAGGAACGDLVHLRVAVCDDRVGDAGFEASGCGATIAAASAAIELVEGAPLLDAARVNSAAIASELGGLSVGKLHAADLAADALHRALGAAARQDAAIAPKPDRTLVALSGGVDSAVAALTAEGEAVAVTLELWRDPDNDGERSCCSADAVRQARALAHRMGLAHFTLDLRDEFRAGVVDPWLADHRSGLTPNPCVGCNGHVRLDQMLAFADRLGAATLTTGHYARRTPDGLLRQAQDPAKDQSYMLAALSRPTLRRLRFPLGDVASKAEVRAIAQQAGLPVAEQGRLAGPLLPRRHRPRPLPRQARRHARAPRRHRRPRGTAARPPPRPPPLHRRPAARPRDRRRGRAALRHQDRPAREHGDGRAEGRAGNHHRARQRTPSPRAGHKRRRGEAALPLARRSVHPRR